MAKRKTLEFLLIVGFVLGLLVLIFALQPRTNHAFRPSIAECRDMNDVTIIVEGRLKKPSKKIVQSYKSKADRNGVTPPPKPIYTFKSTRPYRGLGPTDRWGYHTRFSYVIREGDAPQGALGKEALICLKGSGTSATIRAIYIAD